MEITDANEFEKWLIDQPWTDERKEYHRREFKNSKGIYIGKTTFFYILKIGK